MSDVLAGVPRPQGPLHGLRQLEARMSKTTDFSVYRWEDGGTMTFERRLPIRHDVGEQVTPERVREALEAEVQYFAPARYRVIPEDRWVDITIQARVVLA